MNGPEREKTLAKVLKRIYIVRLPVLLIIWYNLTGQTVKSRSSPVAQLVEQVAVNHPVGSSSLSRGAQKSRSVGPAFFLLPEQ
jgi:hypothetical protein